MQSFSHRSNMILQIWSNTFYYVNESKDLNDGWSYTDGWYKCETNTISYYVDYKLYEFTDSFLLSKNDSPPPSVEFRKPEYA